MLEYNKKILFVGYGAVAQCALPILVKHVKVPYRNITVMDFENKSELLKPWTRRGVRYVRQRITRRPSAARIRAAADVISSSISR